MVASHETRITNLEGKGSPGLRAHETMDDERIGNLKQRVTSLEATIAIVADMRGDLKVIGTKLDKLSLDLQDHVQIGRKGVQ